MRFRVRRKVDLPQPEGPISAVIRLARDFQRDIVQGLEGAVEEIDVRGPQLGAWRLERLGSGESPSIRLARLRCEVGFACRAHSMFDLSARNARSLAPERSGRRYSPSAPVPDSTRPAAQACRCQSSYGAIAWVVDHHRQGRRRLLNAPDSRTGCSRPVNSSGAVSPEMRATPRIMPVMMPLRAAGTTTVAIVRHLLAPSAIAPSRKRLRHFAQKLLGAADRDRNQHHAQREGRRPARRSVFMGTTISVQAKMPITMDGTPFSRSAM